MADLPQAVRLHRLHQRLEHIAPFPRRLLQITQPMTIVNFGDFLARLHPMTT